MNFWFTGTPVMRPPLSPTSNNDLLEKMKQMQMLSSGTMATGTSLTTATSSTPPVPAPGLQPITNAASALPFLQNQLVAAAAAAALSTAPPDPNISSLAAFYNQLAAVDPTMQVSILFPF